MPKYQDDHTRAIDELIRHLKTWKKLHKANNGALPNANHGQKTQAWMAVDESITKFRETSQ